MPLTEGQMTKACLNRAENKTITWETSPSEAWLQKSPNLKIFNQLAVETVPHST